MESTNKAPEKKKQYQTPEVTDYGTVAEVTQTSTNGTANDGNPLCS